jgi:hypothetical protein
VPSATPSGIPYALPADSIRDYPALSQQIAEFLESGIGLRQIGSPVVLGAAAASIDLLSIPAHYRHLRVIVGARCDNTTAQRLRMRLNNDSAANYSWRMAELSAAYATDLGTATAYAECGYATDSDALAGAYAATEIIVADYSDAARATAYHARGMLRDSAPNLFNFLFAGHWHSLAAVNRLTLFPATGNFAVGTYVSLYGME